jgi:hypothetical protein
MRSSWLRPWEWWFANGSGGGAFAQVERSELGSGRPAFRSAAEATPQSRLAKGLAGRGGV